jgi:O-antigen/teichoic acid export membrane protein
MSSANILRSSLANSKQDTRGVIEKLLLRGLVIVVAAVVTSVVLSELVIREILSAQWSAALDIVPILALGSVPAYVAWNVTVVLVSAGRAQVALPAKLLGLVLSVAVAFGAVHGLMLAAVLAVARDLIVCLLTLIPARTLMPVRGLSICLGVFIAGCVGCLGLALS